MNMIFVLCLLTQPSSYQSGNYQTGEYEAVLFSDEENCPPCRILEQSIADLNLDLRIKIHRLPQQYMPAYHAEYLPTLILVRRLQGRQIQELDRWSGAMNVQQLNLFLQQREQGSSGRRHGGRRERRRERRNSGGSGRVQIGGGGGVNVNWGQNWQPQPQPYGGVNVNWSQNGWQPQPYGGGGYSWYCPSGS